MVDTRAKGQSWAIWLQLLGYYLLRTYCVRDRDGGTWQNKLSLCSLKHQKYLYPILIATLKWG